MTTGYTRVPHALLEKIYEFDLSLAEIKVLLVVIRYTYGYHEESAKLSLGILHDKTHQYKHHLCNVVKDLINKNILIEIVPGDRAHARELAINEHLDEWKVVTKFVTVTKNITTGGTKNITTGGTKNITTGGTKNITTHNNKDKFKDNYKDNVVLVVEYLNKRTGKQFRTNSKETTKMIIARFKDGYTLDDCKKVIDNKVSKWKNNPKMADYLRPSTLFRPSNFESYLNEQRPCIDNDVEEII